jgi:hypothetical protein
MPTLAQRSNRWAILGATQPRQGRLMLLTVLSLNVSEPLRAAQEPKLAE